MTGETIYQIVDHWAQATPQAVALVAPDRAPMTYSQLFREVDSMANLLAELGIGRLDRVAIVLSNEIELAITFLAVSCAAVSMPLNPAYPEHQLERFVTDLGARAVIGSADGSSSSRWVAQRRGIPFVEVRPSNSGWFVFNRRVPLDLDLPCKPQPRDVALILHTSGTTAQAKGVPLTHENLCASARAIRDTLQLTSQDRSLGVMPLFHIHGLIGGLLSSLTAGGSFAAVCGFEPNRFFDYIRQFDPTWYTAAPAMHQSILSAARGDGVTKAGRLRFIRSCSAPLRHNVLTELEAFFRVPVIEAYGMTEAAHQITSNPLPPAEHKPGSVGITNSTELAIMDEAGNLLPIGGAGEVVIRGANVMSHYEPEESNAGSFINGWFRTGDLGYLDSEGYLFLAGRIKEIINRGGEKISPSRIDEALLEHPEVLQAATFAVPHSSLGEDVAAAVVVRDPEKISQASLRRYLNDRLAPIEVPSHLFFVQEIPRTSTGKIVRAALSEKFATLLQKPFVAPRDRIESLVAQIYRTVLEKEQVGAEDNFFMLGGNSLHATQVISRVRSMFSVDLPIATLFSKPTVAELAQLIGYVATAPKDATEAICNENSGAETHAAGMNPSSTQGDSR